MRLAVPADLALRPTVLAHGWYQLAPFRWEAGASTLHRVEALPDGTTYRMRIRQPGGRGKPLAVEITPRPGVPGIRDELRARVGRCLNRDLDITGFLELCRRSPHLRYVPRTGAGRFLRCGSLYEDVFKAICGTNIGWAQAVRAMNRVVEASLDSGAGLVVDPPFPAPERILKLGERSLDRSSRLGYRVPYLMEWARRVAEGDPDYARADAGRMDREEHARYLLGVRGIGRTTAQYLMMLRGLAGEVPVDSSVYLFCRINKFGGRTPSEKEIRRLYEPYGAWKAFAYWFEHLPWARRHWGLGGELPAPRPAAGRRTTPKGEPAGASVRSEMRGGRQEGGLKEKTRERRRSQGQGGRGGLP